MIFTIEDIRRSCAGAYAQFPNLLKANLGDYLVFKYKTDYATGSVEVQEIKSMPAINLGIYKVGAGIDVCYFQSPFDSRNFLLYQILISLSKDSAGEIRRLYEGFIIQDIEQSRIEIAEGISKYDEIYSAENFRTSISKYIFGINKVKVVDELCALADIIQGNYEKYGKSFYGGRLAKIISALQDNKGNLIPDNLLATVHYMLVGQLSAISGAGESIIEAKRLQRSNMDIPVIYDTTGWFYNRYDEKWRKQISDVESYIVEGAVMMDSEVLSSDAENLFFTKAGAQFVSESDIELIGGGAVPSEYNKRARKNLFDIAPYLPQVLHHPTLYKEYPFLAFIKCFYIAANGAQEANHCYMQEDNIIIIYSNPSLRHRHTALLHETQHAIQNFEGWSRGGNTFMSQLGMENSQCLRDYIWALGQINNIFDGMDENRLKSISLILNYVGDMDAGIVSREFMMGILSNKQKLDEFRDAFSLNEYELVFGALEKTKSVLELGQKYQNRLQSQGYSGDELNMMIFQAYRMLLGEIEARYTQKTGLSKDMNDYFLPLSAETYKDEDIVIYSDEYKIAVAEKKDFLAAIESYEGKFTMHLRPTKLAEPIAHEIGHILYDDFTNYADLFSAFMSDASEYGVKDFEEYFVQCYLNYLKRMSKFMQADETMPHRPVFAILSAEIKTEDKSVAVDRFLDIVLNGASSGVEHVEDYAKYFEFIKLVSE